MHQILANFASRIAEPSSSCSTAILDNAIWSAPQQQGTCICCKTSQNGYCYCYRGGYWLTAILSRLLALCRPCLHIPIFLVIPRLC